MWWVSCSIRINEQVQVQGSKAKVEIEKDGKELRTGGGTKGWEGNWLQHVRPALLKRVS